MPKIYLNSLGHDKINLDLVDAKAKVPVEHIYLEMAALPIPYELSVNRIIYLSTLKDTRQWDHKENLPL